jgi:hypothetical protein
VPAVGDEADAVRDSCVLIHDHPIEHDVPANPKADVSAAGVLVLVDVRPEEDRSRDPRARADVGADADDRVADLAGIQVAPFRDDRRIDAAVVCAPSVFNLQIVELENRGWSA